MRERRKKTNYLFVIFVGSISFYAAFMFGRIIYAVNFSGIPKIVQEGVVFGEGEELRYIAAGDSNALGLGASRVENTFTYKIGESLGKNYRVIYKDVAEDGAKTRDVINKQLPQIIAFNPDIVVISIGGNDLTHVRPESRIIDNYETIINEIKNKTSAKLYITDIPNFMGTELLPMWYREVIDMRSKRINPKILAMKGDRVVVIDAYNKWYEIENVEETYAADEFHTNDKGHQFWANTVLELIESTTKN